MGKQYPEVSRHIDHAENFPRPILKRLRRSFHIGCPDIELAIKCGVPLMDIQNPRQHAGFLRSKSRLDSEKVS